MIKMYINNEEVVSNKEFTISEEMLATPSTVLNNCYPALWENTKDYVSKFYFPKDYSKCIIGDGEFEKGSQRNIIKKVSGISPSFETNITKPWESLTIDGNSYQATSTDPVSPSPDYPSEIEVATGSVSVKSTGKNLLNIQAIVKGRLDKGVVGYASGTTDLTLNENSFSFTTNTYWRGITTDYISANENTTYKYSSDFQFNFSTSAFICACYDKNKNWLGNSSTLASGDYARQVTTLANTKYIRINIQIRTAGTVTINNPQLEKGPIATDYKPYTEQVVNIDLKGNELCSLPDGTKDELVVKNGRAKIIKRIGKVVLDGSEAISYTRYGENKRFTIIPENYKEKIYYNGNELNTMCNRFYASYDNTIGKYLNTTTIPSIWCHSIGIFILVPPSMNINNSNEMRQWLSTHNTTVQYKLKTPEEIDLGEVTLPNTLIGQNNVTLDATLETNMEISYYYSSYDLLFAGVVKKTGNISLNPRYPHYADIQVLDFKTFLSEGETLNFVIDNKTIGQAIDMVIDAIKSYGFVKGNIMLDDINEVIGAYSTDKKTAYDVFQYFSDITNSRWFTRMIDEDTVAIDFYDTDKLPVKPKIEYTEDWFCNNLIDDMSYSIKTDDYRNKQILLSDEVFGSTPYNDLLTSNGYNTSYTTTGKIASLTSAKIDGKNATFTTEANKEGGVEADIYYKPGEVGITTNNQVGAGKVIEITYIPLVEGREIIINDEEVNRIGSQLNRNGVISRYENRNDTTSSDELRQIGQTYIKYKGKAEVTLKITSRKNIYDIGDKVQFDAPLEDLSTEYMVKKKTTKYIVTANQLFYDYELSSSFNSESEINYFDNQRSKHKGNLSEGDYITRDIDITNSANIIWHDTSIDEISITGNNVLDCALDSPFTD